MAVARGSEGSDQEVSRRFVWHMAMRVTALGAALVFAGALIVFSYLAYKIWVDPDTQSPTSRHVVIAFEPWDVAIGIAALGISAVVLAGLASAVIARRAVKPLEESLRRQRAFVADASHELRTPLSVVHARTQYLQSVVDDDVARSVVADLREDTQILIDIVDDLLLSAEDAPVEQGSASVDECFSDIERDMSWVGAERDVRVMVEPISARVALPMTAFRRCVVALVDNALSHSPRGAAVVVSASLAGDMLAIRVRDEGVGIRGISPDRIFDRFAHGNPSGHGIGLALVRDTLGRYGGSVVVEKTGSDGTTFFMRIPRVTHNEERE